MFTISGISNISGITRHGAPLQVVATRANFGCDYAGTLSPTTARTYRFNFGQIISACNYIQLLYANYAMDTSFDSNTYDTLTVKGALDDGSSNVYPVTFNGQSTTTLAPGAVVLSDPLVQAWSAGTSVYQRTYVVGNSAGSWPLPFQGNGQYTGATNEGKQLGDHTGDTVTSWNSANLTYSNGNWGETASQLMYGPLAILGIQTTYAPSVALIGDSIMRGGQVEMPNVGYVRAAFGNSNMDFGVNMATFNLGHTGEYASGFANTGKATGYQTARRDDIVNRYCSSVVCDYGINDIINDSAQSSTGTLSAIQTALGVIWNRYAVQGKRIWQTTLLPYDGGNTGQKAVRVSVNNWLRTIPSPLSGVFDAASLVEVNSSGGTTLTQNGGFWYNTYSTDGIHPITENAYTTLKAAINTSVFT